MSKDFTDINEDHSSKDQLKLELVDLLDSNKDIQAKELFESLHSADQADFIDRVSIVHRKKIIEIARKNFDPKILVDLDDNVFSSIIRLIGIKEIAKMIEELEPEEASSVISSIDEELQGKIIKNISLIKRREIKELLSYPKNSVGRMMTKSFVAVPGHWDVKRTFDFIRSEAELPDELNDIIIVDPKFRPIGLLPIISIINKKNNVIISSLILEDLKIVNANNHQEEISYLFTQYSLSTVPVVNKTGRLVGIIPIKDAIDVVEKEVEEDMMHMGGINETDIHLPVLDIVKKRLPWLIINLITSVIAAFVISLFNDTISKLVILASIMPIVATTGGSAGTQSMTVSVVSLSSKELTSLNTSRVVIKQILCSLITGSVLSLIGSLILLVYEPNFKLCLVFSIAIITNFIIAGLSGTLIPVLLTRINIDPAIASPVLITSITDLVGFFAFLGVASLLLV